jgi:hypothetical protein
MSTNKKRTLRFPILLGLSWSISIVLLIHNVWLTKEMTTLKSTKTSYEKIPQREIEHTPEPEERLVALVEPHPAHVPSQQGKKVFLLVLVPTVHRATSTLLPVLQSILRQVSNTFLEINCSHLDRYPTHFLK